jgi:hypothetical protein
VRPILAHARATALVAALTFAAKSAICRHREAGIVRRPCWRAEELVRLLCAALKRDRFSSTAWADPSIESEDTGGWPSDSSRPPGPFLPCGAGRRAIRATPGPLP